MDKISIPSDIIGTLPPLCPSDTDNFGVPIDCNDSISDTTHPKSNIPYGKHPQSTRKHPHRHQTDDSDFTASSLMDTIHYLSPVSPLSPRSVYEGDIDYLKLLPEPGYIPELSSVSSSTISCIEPQLQRTVAIVKPEAMEYQDVIVRAVNEAGFSFIDKRVIHFTPEEVSEFYCQYYGSPAFPHQVVSMSVGPVLVLSIADVCAVTKWKDMIGPEKLIREEWFYPMSMRVRFGLVDTRAMIDSLHASENLTDAYRENRYVFPENVLEPIVEEINKVTDFCQLYVNPTLLAGLVQLVKVKPSDPVLFLADWLLMNNPYQPKYDKDIGLLPT